MVTMITAGIESKGHVVNHATTDVSFRDGFLAVTNIIFAYRELKLESREISCSNKFCSCPHCLLWIYV